MKSPGRDRCLVPRPGTQSGCRAGSAHPSAVRRWASGLASLSLGFLLGRTGVPLQAGRRLGPRAGSVLGAMALTFWLHSGAILRCPQRRTEAHTTPSCTGPPHPVGGGQGGSRFSVIGLSHLQTINVNSRKPCQSPTTGCNCPLYLPLPFIKTATEPADKQDNYM